MQIDEERLQRRIETHFAGERRTQAQVVDGAGAGLDPVAARDLGPIDGEVPERHLEEAAADVLPRADEGGQRADGADRLAAAGVAFQRDADADDRGLRGCEFLGELPDFVGLDARDLLDVFGRELGGAILQFRIAVGVLVDPFLIDEALRDDRVDEAHRKRAIGAGLGTDVPVGGFGGARPVTSR